MANETEQSTSGMNEQSTNQSNDSVTPQTPAKTTAEPVKAPATAPEPASNKPGGDVQGWESTTGFTKAFTTKIEPLPNKSNPSLPKEKE